MTALAPRPRRPVPAADAPVVEVGARPLRIADVVALSQGRVRVALPHDETWRRRAEGSVAFLHRRMELGGAIYGVTTGVGDSCTNVVAARLSATLSANLVRFHGCGTGEDFAPHEAAAIVAARLGCLARGYSGVRPQVLDRLCTLLNEGILPLIPSLGSVGASGDLTPLSYLAAALTGEREVSFADEQLPAAAALARLGLAPLALGPKEALALMNGTSAMTGLACLAHDRAARLGRLAAALTAMMSDLVRGNRGHFAEAIFALKPHPGSVTVARWIRQDVELGPGEPAHAGRLQDRYSIRCAPQVIGVLLDALAFCAPTIEVELNSVNDNPVVDGEQEELLHGGNFYGGHIALAMDSLKAVVASVADLLDRQLALLCNPLTSNGLPADLVAAEGAERFTHHGFKAMQIAASALTAEALKLTVPAASFSRSTESHNQDKVSMGTIAARDCLRVLDLTETVAIILLLACCQGVDLRGGAGCHRRSQELHAAVRRSIPAVRADRRQDLDITRLLALYRGQALPLGAPAGP